WRSRSIVAFLLLLRRKCSAPFTSEPPIIPGWGSPPRAGYLPRQDREHWVKLENRGMACPPRELLESRVSSVPFRAGSQRFASGICGLGKLNHFSRHIFSASRQPLASRSDCERQANTP